MPTKIKLIRVLRNCGHNDDALAEGKKNQLLYDVQVEIAGEIRGVWERRMSSTGYDLYTPDREPITEKPPTDSYSRRAAQIASKKDMLATSMALFSAGRFPTLEDLANRREGTARALAMAQERVILQRREDVLARHALGLFTLVKRLKPANQQDAADIDAHLFAIANSQDQAEASLKDYDPIFKNGHYDAYSVWRVTY